MQQVTSRSEHPAAVAVRDAFSAASVVMITGECSKGNASRDEDRSRMKNIVSQRRVGNEQPNGSGPQ